MESKTKHDPESVPVAGSSASRSASRKTSANAIAMVMEIGAAVKTPAAPEKFSKRQWILLIFFGVIDFLSAMTISLQAPFFPAEAERKGSTAKEYGLVFGIFELMVFIMAPVFGKYMNKIGPQTLFSVSILVNSIAVICFGLLDRINDHIWFITLCYITRVFEGLGCAGFFVSTFVIIACEFPKNVATTFASLETFIGLGLIVGPTVGGALYGIGGFPLPFFVAGGCLMTTGLSAVLFMPKTEEEKVKSEGYSVFKILKIPSVALAALSTMSTAMSFGFLSSILEPHIRRFGLTPLQTGLVFVVNGGVYALTAPLLGYICSKVRPYYVNIVGNFLICISFILIGPAVFVPVDTILWMTIIGLSIQGLGFGCCFVSSFVIGLQDSIKHGLPDNLATYAVCSGLWQAMVSLGAFIGPSAGGLLYDTVGFRESSWLILITSFLIGMAIIMHSCIASPTSSTKSSDDESEPLLQSKGKPTLVTRMSALEDSDAVQPFSSSPPSSSSYGSASHGSGEHVHAH